MIAFEVSLNGKRICIAGAEDLVVLTTIVTAVGRLGRRTVPARPDQSGREIHYSIGGLTARKNPEKDVHVKWKSVAPLQVGDVIQVKIIETEKADRASSRQNAKRRPGEPSGFRQRRSHASFSKRESATGRA